MRKFFTRSNPLLEYSQASASTHLDREHGILSGVKILGLVSLNARRYDPQALRRARKLYENAKVNVNHPKDSPQAPRDYQDRIGSIRNVQFREMDGLYADFHFNPRHPLAGQLMWDAEHSPENVGFSHNILARTRAQKDGTLLVEEITAVRSVDLVADPATTNGLFEAADPTEPLPAVEPESAAGPEPAAEPLPAVEPEPAVESDSAVEPKPAVEPEPAAESESAAGPEPAAESEALPHLREIPMLESIRSDLASVQEGLDALRTQFQELLRLHAEVSAPVSRIPDGGLTERALSTDEFVKRLRQ